MPPQAHVAGIHRTLTKHTLGPDPRKFCKKIKSDGIGQITSDRIGRNRTESDTGQKSDEIRQTNFEKNGNRTKSDRIGQNRTGFPHLPRPFWCLGKAKLGLGHLTDSSLGDHRARLAVRRGDTWPHQVVRTAVGNMIRKPSGPDARCKNCDIDHCVGGKRIFHFFALAAAGPWVASTIGSGSYFPDLCAFFFWWST